MSSHNPKKVLGGSADFEKLGFRGFTFPLETRGVEISVVESHTGHDDFVTSPDITHIYYIINGTGEFVVSGDVVACGPGDLMEVGPNTEFTYTGRMQLLLIMIPPFAEGTTVSVRPNSNVISGSQGTQSQQ